MKLNNLIPQRSNGQIILRFGDAELLAQSNGQYELIGGSDADQTAVLEWASFFAHEIVFTHFHRTCRASHEQLPPQNKFLLSKQGLNGLRSKLFTAVVKPDV